MGTEVGQSGDLANFRTGGEMTERNVGYLLRFPKELGMVVYASNPRAPEAEAG